MTIFSLPTFSYTPPPPSPLLHTLGARVGVHLPPPLGGLLATFSPYGSLTLLRFSPYGELFFYHVGAFLVHFSPYGELFFTMWGIFSPLGFFCLYIGHFPNFFSMWGPFGYVYILIGTFFYHVGDILLRFSFYWELVLPCGGIFATFFPIWGTFLYIWWAFLYIRGAFCTYGGPFLYTWGAFWDSPPPP